MKNILKDALNWLMSMKLYLALILQQHIPILAPLEMNCIYSHNRTHFHSPISISLTICFECMCERMKSYHFVSSK